MKYLAKYALAALLGFAAIPAAHAIPPIEEVQLDNGLRVLLMEAHNVPMVVMRLTVPVGSRLDPVGKDGTASMLATMLEDHTARHDYAAWADLLDAEAIRLGAGADRDSLSIYMTVLKEALPEGARAFAEAALMPGWNKKRFSVLRANAVDAAKKSLEGPGVRAAQLTSHMLYPHHGYGHRSDGDAASLGRIGLTDLESLYRQQFMPQGAVLAVSGDIGMKALLAKIRPLFSHWKGAPKMALKDVPQPENIHGKQQNVVMSTKQMTVQLSRLGPSRYAPDFFADMLMNHILGGGGFSSRLMSEVRVKRGLVYGVYSYFLPLAVSGPFVLTLQTRADQAGQALRVAQDVMRQMHDGHISQPELAAAKANLTGGFAHRMDSNAKRVGLMSMIGFYGLPLNYLQAWKQRINAVTLAEVKAAATRFLAPADWNTVRVGPKPGRLMHK
ncbi:MAG: pitrilysin family protein [Mariprofundaceae bacterium]|nr:pitrilysin family protein [Mariprofundaceae bacterium]